ncbi:ATP synthase delta chain, chloroplastic [Linum perenne]
MSSSVAESYATALLEVAQTTNTLETTSADLEKLYSVYADPQQHVSNFLNIIIDGQRVNAVLEIVREFEAAYNRLTDTELALVSSVVTLESQHLAQICQADPDADAVTPNNDSQSQQEEVDFAFDFSSDLEKDSLPADRLFHAGIIRPPIRILKGEGVEDLTEILDSPPVHPVEAIKLVPA